MQLFALIIIFYNLTCIQSLYCDFDQIPLINTCRCLLWVYLLYLGLTWVLYSTVVTAAKLNYSTSPTSPPDFTSTLIPMRQAPPSFLPLLTRLGRNPRSRLHLSCHPKYKYSMYHILKYGMRR